jgi:hypothetical protein
LSVPRGTVLYWNKTRGDLNNMSENRFNEEEFLKKVENAARKGASSK